MSNKATELRSAQRSSLLLHQQVSQSLMDVRNDRAIQSQISLMKTKVESLKSLLLEKDAEYSMMCQQFEQSLRQKNQQVRAMEANVTKVSAQNGQAVKELVMKNKQIRDLELMVEKLNQELLQRDNKLSRATQREQHLQNSMQTLSTKLRSAEQRLVERERELENLARKCESVRQVQSNEISRLAESNALLKEGLDGYSRKVEEKEETMFKLRQELSSMVTVATERQSQIAELQQMFQQKMSQVCTIQDYLAEEHRKCVQLEKSCDEANKELDGLRSCSSCSTDDQAVQTDQLDCSIPSSRSSDELEALKKYHEDLEGTVSQLENILQVRNKRITELELQLKEATQAQKEHMNQIRLKMLRSAVEEKESSITLLEVGDCCRGQLEDLQRQRDVLQKMLRQQEEGACTDEAHPVVDKTACQLKCLLQQLVTLMKTRHDHTSSDQCVTDTPIINPVTTDDDNRSQSHSNLLSQANTILNNILLQYQGQPLPNKL